METNKSIKILAVGNSFSVDAYEYLFGLLEFAGYCPTIGNLYIGGCDLETHLANAKSEQECYTYYKNTDGVWQRENNRSLKFGILDEEWDIISFQQASAKSGFPESITESIDGLVSFADEHKRNKNAEYFWLLTWAYQADSTREAFADYDRNQKKMYAAIVSAVKSEILTRPAFKKIIPAGTAIQNARTFFGDVLTRDGFHLDLTIGRFIAAFAIYGAITGDTDIPESIVPFEISNASFAAVREAVKDALKNPYEVTEPLNNPAILR